MNELKWKKQNDTKMQYYKESILVEDENTIYEIDSECMRKKNEKKNVSKNNNE